MGGGNEDIVDRRRDGGNRAQRISHRDISGTRCVHKAVRNKVTYAHAGIGAASHLCGTLFRATIGTQMTTVPYKGNGPIMTDLIGGQINMICDQATNTVGPITRGNNRHREMGRGSRPRHLGGVDEQRGDIRCRITAVALEAQH